MEPSRDCDAYELLPRADPGVSSAFYKETRHPPPLATPETDIYRPACPRPHTRTPHRLTLMAATREEAFLM